MIEIYVLLAAVAYLMFAFVGVADKFLVSKIVREPVAYAFYTAVTGPFSLVLVPFGAKLIPWDVFLVALLAGASFISFIYCTFSAIKRSSISRVIPIQGGLVPTFVFLFAYFILGERLAGMQALGFVFLVMGSVIISIRKEHGAWTSGALFYATLAAMSLALSSVLTKFVFEESNFISGMVWTRIGFLLPIPLLLFKKASRQAIFNAPKEAGVKNVALYYSSRATGTVAGFLQNYAVSLGSVSIVNAMQGVQFVFLLILSSALSIYYPNVLKEKITADAITLKLAAIAVISCGLYLLFSQ